MIFQRRCIIKSIGRTADLEKNNGDDTIMTSLVLESFNTGFRYELKDLDVPMDDDGYLRLLRAFRNKEPIQFTIYTDDVNEQKMEEEMERR